MAKGGIRMKKIGMSLKTVICVAILAALIFGYYNYTSNRGKQTDTNTQADELQTLLAKDLEEAYPSTPREVVKLYSRIIKVLYDKELENSQVEKLGEQNLKLFDEELLAVNPQDTYFINLKSEIVKYKEEKSSITKYVIADSEDVEYWEDKEQSFASLTVTFSVKEKSSENKIKEKFLLRQDEEGRWKILGWETQ